jgi:hypothetical protein
VDLVDEVDRLPGAPLKNSIKGPPMYFVILGFVLLSEFAALAGLYRHQSFDHRGRIIGRYLTLPRFPLAYFLMIATFPVLALEGAPSLLGNILVFDSTSVG